MRQLTTTTCILPSFLRDTQHTNSSIKQLLYSNTIIAALYFCNTNYHNRPSYSEMVKHNYSLLIIRNIKLTDLYAHFPSKEKPLKVSSKLACQYCHANKISSLRIHLSSNKMARWLTLKVLNDFGPLHQ